MGGVLHGLGLNICDFYSRASCYTVNHMAGMSHHNTMECERKKKGKVIINYFH